MSGRAAGLNTTFNREEGGPAIAADVCYAVRQSGTIGKPTSAQTEPKPMGFGDTAKKVQNLADRAEQLYAQLKDIRERVIKLERAAEETDQRVGSLQNETEKQRVLLEAIAREQGIDVDETLAEAAIEEAEDSTDDLDAVDADASTDVAESEDEPVNPADEPADS